MELRPKYLNWKRIKNKKKTKKKTDVGLYNYFIYNNISLFFILILCIYAIVNIHSLQQTTTKNTTNNQEIIFFFQKFSDIIIEFLFF